MEIVGWAGALGSEAANRERLGDVVQGLLGRRAVDRVIVALPEGRGTLPVSELLQLRLTGAVIEEASSLLEKISGKIEVDSLRPSALIYADGFRLRPRYRIVRRALSFTVAFCALAVCAPLLPFIALAIKLSSPGPVLFSQTRVGRGGEPFTLYKFRSMRNDAEQVTGAVWAQKNDSRVTRVGQFLRRTRLDEIPQLWNVLRGDMNFVGPRPERPEFVCWLVDQIPYYNLRHIVRPGVTGWAQIRYRYGASVQDSKEKLEYDLYYIKHFSLALDLLIMFETIKTIILRRGAQ
jgi:sugar transferase (PEP-CTERM system associated)